MSEKIFDKKNEVVEFIKKKSCRIEQKIITI